MTEIKFGATTLRVEGELSTNEAIDKLMLLGLDASGYSAGVSNVEEEDGSIVKVITFTKTIGTKGNM